MISGSTVIHVFLSQPISDKDSTWNAKVGTSALPCFGGGYFMEVRLSVDG